MRPPRGTEGMLCILQNPAAVTALLGLTNRSGNRSLHFESSPPLWAIKTECHPVQLNIKRGTQIEQ